ncbi:MAG: hypothetical protein AAF439_04300 [Pseudomonadota bacterium]
MRILGPLGVLLGAAACTPEAKLPDLRVIYERAADASRGEDRPPLIAVPGILGSRLVDTATDKVIWGGGARGLSADPEDPADFLALALPIGPADQPLTRHRDRVRADGILDTASVDILGVEIDIDVYIGVARTLDAGGFRVSGQSSFDGPGAPVTLAEPIETSVEETEERQEATSDFNAFRFDYDWRRDLIETAHAFGRFLRRRQIQVATARGVAPDEVKFDLIAHSMGGLVSRYFLMYGDAAPGPDGTLPPITWDGARFFSRAIFVAPPNAGSISAMTYLVNGRSLGPFQPHFPATLLATHPSIYQLMPRSRHNRLFQAGAPVEDLYDIKLWRENGWGLTGPEADTHLALLLPEVDSPTERRKIALKHKARLLERAEQFHTMMDRWAPPPADLDLFLVVGGGFETPATANILPDRTIEIADVEEGDGVVLRSSALLDERLDGDFSNGLRSPLRFKTTLFLPDEHIELTKNPVFGDNLLFWLLEAPRPAEELARPDRGSLLIDRPRAREAAPPPDQR